MSSKELAEEVAALREEVRHLREALAAAEGQQVHLHYAPSPVALTCTCGSTGGCQVHPPARWGNVWITPSACAGPAPVPQVLTYNTTCAAPAMIPAGDYISSAAGCAGAGAQVYSLQLPAS